MKKIVVKIIYILIIVFIILGNLNFSLGTVDDLISGLSGATNQTDISTLKNGINIIYTLIRYAGTGISIIVVMTLAIKYMIASVEAKAEIKKQAIPILVGCFFIFATSNIIGIVGDLLNGVV